ncbi:hypothetical protein STANM309S_01432 [Streptomyces tanashiensis]
METFSTGRAADSARIVAPLAIRTAATANIR